MAACGAPPNRPDPPPPAAPQIACPVDLTVTGVTGSSQAVTFDAPTVTGGATPVSVTCNPVSGAPFPLGASSVSCAASDAQSRQATCSFKVTLTPQTLSVTKYAAFGDSLTEGEIGRPNVAPSLLDIPNAYPTKLQQALDATYPGQGVVVINHGVSGETIDKTELDIVKFLPIDRPGAVLLLSGYNNLTTVCGPGQANTGACGKGLEAVEIGVRDCLRRISESNVGVKYTFVSTLTPPGPSGSQRIDANAIIQANIRIKQRTAAGGAVLVDSYANFVGHEAEYVNVDGLHLRPAGYQALADGFFAAIKSTVPQTSLFSTARPR